MFQRFSNMIHLASSNVDTIWNILKETKLNVYDKCVNGLYGKNFLISQVEAIHKKLNMNATEDIFNNITDTTLKSAAEMFLFLNSCPDDLRYWYLLYADLFENKAPEVIVLTLNRIMKGERNPENKRLKDIAKHLLKRVDLMLSTLSSYTSSKVSSTQAKNIINITPDTCIYSDRPHQHTHLSIPPIRCNREHSLNPDRCNPSWARH